MNNEQYIEHEIKLRVIKETTDVRFLEMQNTNGTRFSSIEKELNRIENKINWVLGVLVTSIIIPSLLKLTHFL
jgi:hypothetical protein